MSNFKRANWNTHEATYFQKIYFTHGKELTGYSQKLGFAEKNDKTDVLINWILRMHKSGYLDRNNTSKEQIDCIEYYLNNNPQILIVRLYYDFFELINPEYELNKRFITFLNKFYQMVKAGERSSKIYETLYIKKRRIFKDPFDLSTKRFLTVDSLNEYCWRMMEKHKATKSEVEHFYIKYKSKYFH